MMTHFQGYLSVFTKFMDRSSFFVLAFLLNTLAFQGHVSATTESQKVPSIVVTIKPIYELTKTIMKGVGEPHLILDGTYNPHNVMLKPSQTALIKNSDLLIWVGPTLENFMIKPLMIFKNRKLTLMGINGMKLLSRSSSDSCVLREACDDLDKVQKQIVNLENLFDKEVISLDPHIWLYIDNVILMVKEIAHHLSAVDLINAKTYQENADALLKRLYVFKGELETMAKPLTHFHFIAFHDAYGYMEYAYKFKNSAADIITSGHSPGLKSVAAIRKIVRQKGIKCIVVDPQHPSTLEQKIARDLNMTLMEADPLGLEIGGGDNHYFELMRQLITEFVECRHLHGKPRLKSHTHKHNHTHTHEHDAHIPHDHK